MRRNLVHPGADLLKYEIRQIVQFANELRRFGVSPVWENIGDPINKGERLPDWMKEIVACAAREDESYGYVDSQGVPETREFLAQQVNARGGTPVTRDDIIFFNGLGDAVAKVFGFLRREARVLGPSPAYSTHSSAEAAHSGYEHLHYRLDPERDWLPDLDDVEMKVRYNDSIAGILLINPDNPTGAVYPREVVERFVEIARRYDVFLLCDETYANIVYNGAETVNLSEVIGDVPGISLRSVSKEFPWPGARCGWAEVYNQKRDENFSSYIRSIVDSKRLEVCSTSLPQLTIPSIMSDPRYPAHLERRRRLFEARANEAYELFAKVPGIRVTRPRGALYFTVVFEEGVLNGRQRLSVADPELARFIEERTSPHAANGRPPASNAPAPDVLAGRTGTLPSSFTPPAPDVIAGRTGTPPSSFAPPAPDVLAGRSGTLPSSFTPPAPDKRFVYWLLAATGICVVPLSGFACDLPGFRMTLLECDDEKRAWVQRSVADAIREYLGSAG